MQLIAMILDYKFDGSLNSALDTINSNMSTFILGLFNLFLKTFRLPCLRSSSCVVTYME